MDRATYVDETCGRVERVPGPHGYDFYVPAPLPRSMDLGADVVVALSNADRALGRLAGAGRLLPDPHLLVRPYLVTEALASSRIEGTQASLSEVLEADVEAEPSEDHDVREVQNYIAAFTLGRALLEDLPLSLRLVKRIHERLLTGVRGEEKRPGEFRTSQNWIGSPGGTLEQAAYVPPRHDPEMLDALRDWESFLNEDLDLPPLVAAGLLHLQFESIHPFLDGNGRIGRLMVTLYLLATDELPEPLLYLSPWFERHRDEYYAKLQGVRERGELQSWLRFFLDGVGLMAAEAIDRAESLTDLQRGYREALVGDRSNASAVVDLLFENPFVTTRRVMNALDVTNAGANNAIRRLEDRGWLSRRGTSGRGGRITWAAPEILTVLGRVEPRQQ